MSVKVFSRFDRPATIPASFGTGIAPVFEERIVNGVKQLVKVAEEPISPRIQEAKADCMIYNILARYQRGDLSALSANAGQFMDVTSMPTTLAEAQQKLIDVRNRFEQMPLEIRQQFGNSVDQFIEAVSTGNAKDILDAFLPAESVPAEPVPAEPVPAVKE